MWTHTVLIEFADLAGISNLRQIADLLSRPTPGQFEQYRNPIDFRDSQPKRCAPAAESLWVSAIALALYSDPKQAVVAVREPEVDVDELVLALWEQQWPKLRRSFRFCTLSLSDRSQDSMPFDLQLLPAEAPHIRSRFPEITTVNSKFDHQRRTLWLQDVLDDLRIPDQNGLRAFLRAVGSETGGERSNFLPITAVHAQSLKFGSDGQAVNSAIEIVSETKSISQSRFLLHLLLDAAAKHPEFLAESSLRWLLENIGHLERAEWGASETVLLGFLWSKYPERFLEIAAQPGRRDYARRLIAILPTPKILECIQKNPALVDGLITLRPELLEDPSFWSSGQVLTKRIAEIASAELNPPKVVGAMLAAHRSDLAADAFELFGASYCLEALSTATETETHEISQRRAWLMCAISDVTKIGEAFASRPGWQRKFLVEVARLMAPERLPNAYGEDPWLIALKRSIGILTESDNLYLSAYLLNRALSGSSKSADELVRKTFDPVYIPAAEDRLPEEAWRVVEYRLPWSFFWYDWDRCVRIRSAVVSLYVESDLPVEGFTKITASLSIFEELVKVASENRRGRNYLRRVKEYLNRSADHNAIRKMEIIEQAL